MSMRNNKSIEQMIGARIQKIRKSRGYTQQQFAEMVNLSTNYLSDIERGKSSPRMDKLTAIINALECSADEIFADVITYGYKVKVSRIAEMLEKLPVKERNRAIALLEAFIENQ